VGVSLFNTPRNFANKIPAIKRVATPAAATLPSENGGLRKRVDSDQDMFSIGLSGTDTPIASGPGDETPGHTLAATEALLAEVNQRTEVLSDTDAEQGESKPIDEKLENDTAQSAEPIAEKQALNITPIPVEDVSILSREELEAKYKALAQKAAQADVVLKTTSPLLAEGISDTDALDGWIKMTSGKAEMGAVEIKRLHDQLACELFVDDWSLDAGPSD
jgi:hypothetical protein